MGNIAKKLRLELLKITIQNIINLFTKKLIKHIKLNYDKYLL